MTIPVHANGQWYANGTSFNMYTVPIRHWDFDPRFNDVAMLPPMTPTFISVQQIVIGEDFRCKAEAAPRAGDPRRCLLPYGTAGLRTLDG